MGRSFSGVWYRRPEYGTIPRTVGAMAMSSKIDGRELGGSPTPHIQPESDQHHTSDHLAITGDSKGLLRSHFLTDSSQRSLCPNLVQKKKVSTTVQNTADVATRSPLAL